MIIIIRILSFLIVGINLVFAADVKTITKPISNGIRIIFIVNDPKVFDITENNSKIIVNLGADTPSFINLNHNIIKNTTKNGNDIVIELNNQARFRKFISDKFVGLDIISINKPIDETFSQKETSQSQNNIDLKQPKITPLNQGTKKTSKRLENKATSLGKLLAGSTERGLAHPKEPVQVKEQFASPATIPEIKNTKVSSANIDIKVDNKESLSPQNIIKFDQNNERLIISFPWDHIVPAVSFNRGDNFYIIFGSYHNPPVIPKDIPYDIGNIEFVTKDGFVIYKFRIQQNNLDLVRSNNTWHIVIPNDRNKKRIPTKLKPYDFEDSDLVIDIPYADKYLEFTDPLIGDQLLIYPLANDLYYVDQTIASSDYEIINTFQGIVIVKNNDQLRTEVTSHKVKLFSPSSKKRAYGANKFQNQNSFFDFGNWSKVKDHQFDDQLNNLFLKVSNSSKEQKSIYRLEIAKHYFKNKFLSEAVAMLNFMEKSDPYFCDKVPEVKIFKAASEYLMGRYQSSKQTWDEIDFDPLPPKFHNELFSWIAANQQKINPEFSKYQINFLTYQNFYFVNYPDELKNQFALQELESNLAIKNLPQAGKLITYLSLQKLKNSNDLEYLKGVYYYLSGNNKKAEVILNKLSANYEDPKNRFKAVLKLVETKLNNKELNQNQAIELLNKVKFTWRGDEIEVSYLELLAELYWETKQYDKALLSWKQIVNNFSSSPSSILVASKMSESFADLISNEQKYLADDFTIVAIFNEFQELTPLGKLGDQVNRSIIAKVVKLDLLEQASSLLNHQIKFRTEGETRNNLIADLAYVQIINSKPREALETLNLSLDQPLNKELEKRYFYLKIKALINAGLTNEALDMIGYRDDEQSLALRMDILWSNKDWNNIKKYYDPLSEALWEFSIPPSETQQRMIVKLAVAYAKLNDHVAVKRIAERFLDKINPASPGWEVLNFIARDTQKLDIKSIDKNLGVDQFELFLKEYHQRIINQSL
ncbi:tetratricopeptide repeat protein [Rickettsiales endosymbiont of Stachyamoeba lipophora]|uniref:tetratricopeptide repeat protein n=1 Tax=Rickettsiales endosymbiont of Stachyamoeba lipophora TaxID=2486578 RepID=UPI000F655E7B|nr:hypothetical protein [Rickettsiales endosymbiont of Stachyamoeba lipophora]AZL15642.1 hypothetical protein EF513_03645 [Rickettsiales endosymbiont of Stachyamoeba lipophora]